MEKETAQENTQVDRESDPEFLQFKVKYFERLKDSVLYQQKRLRELMERPGTKKWTPEKIAKMTRRFVATQETIKAAEQAISETNTKISALTTPTLTNEAQPQSLDVAARTNKELSNTHEMPAVVKHQHARHARVPKIGSRAGF